MHRKVFLRKFLKEKNNYKILVEFSKTIAFLKDMGYNKDIKIKDWRR